MYPPGQTPSPTYCKQPMLLHLTFRNLDFFLNCKATVYASLEATDAWRIARFFAKDSDLRSRSSLRRVTNNLW